MLELRARVTQIKATHNKYVVEHGNFTRGTHELNRLTSGYQDFQNLDIDIPIKEFHRAPEDLELILQFNPEAKRTPFKDPLKELPPGTWGNLRVFKDADNTPQLIAKTKGEDFYIAKAFSEYRTN